MTANIFSWSDNSYWVLQTVSLDNECAAICAAAMMLNSEYWRIGSVMLRLMSE